ncbi:MAG TPA: carboxypeptidase-like regulatory domain-containing protein, partial [Flavitalea sp.]|nr:carboxypeptidase-like regulatory domain-containing protein [Flavitalea sp.]
MLAQFTPRLRSLLYFFTFLFFVPLKIFAQDVTVTGTVVDQDSKSPLADVTVLLKGTKTGTTTDASGKYSLRVPSLSGTLVFTNVGYGNQEIEIKGKATIDVNLSQASSNLNEVVVIGYGTAAKKDLTGSVGSIKATQLENENPSSVQDVLRGNVAGLNISQVNAASAKGGGDVLIRGKSSIRAGTSPLIVLDGVIYPGQLSDINPNDISTVDVLKDASSAAVFGAKSASGVILVTTKKGSKGKPTITVNSNIGMSELAQNEHLYDGPGFVAWRTNVQKARNYGSAKNFT